MGGSWYCFTHITSDPATWYRGIQSSKPQDTNLCAIHAKRVTIMPKDSHFLFCLGQICSYGSYGSYGVWMQRTWWDPLFRRIWDWAASLTMVVPRLCLETICMFVWNAYSSNKIYMNLYGTPCSSHSNSKVLPGLFFGMCTLKNLHLWSRKYRHFLQSLQWQDVQLARRLRGERTWGVVNLVNFVQALPWLRLGVCSVPKEYLPDPSSVVR